MYCVKCGTKLPDDRVFCDSCLADMERYPVKPGTAVYLPRQDAQWEAKKPAPRKKTVSPEETAARLRRTVAWLTGLAVVLAVLLSISVAILARQLWKADRDEDIGKNYSTIQPSDPTT